MSPFHDIATQWCWSFLVPALSYPWRCWLRSCFSRAELFNERAELNRSRARLLAIATVVGLAWFGGIGGLSTANAVDPIRPIKLVDVTADSGIGFQHTNGSTGEYFIVETVVGGLAQWDYDRDGRIDIYFPNCGNLPDRHVSPEAHSFLYRNLGEWKFYDASMPANLAISKYPMGVTVGDFDNDGFQDLFINNFGHDQLLRNNGDGTFLDVTSEANVAGKFHVGAGASFLDVDRDGDLDLYAGRYVDFTYEKQIVKWIGKHRFHPGPADYSPVPDTLYLNLGDGTFEDASVSSGIAAVAGYSMGMLAADWDDDGDTDIFVCNDGTPNFLFVNDGKGHFTEQATIAGVAYNSQGAAQSDMGVDGADVNNDGLLDLISTSYQSEMPLLFLNLGQGVFEDATVRSKMDPSLFPHVKWGATLTDFDNDGWRDLFIACGHFMDNVSQITDRTAVKVSNSLMQNLGNAQFRTVSANESSVLSVIESSRGCAADDLDNDGDVDLAILNVNAKATLSRNDTSTESHWCQLELVGVASNRDAVGARITLESSGKRWVSEVFAGRGYQSHWGSRQYFGLGTHRVIDKVEIRWPSGLQEQFRNVPVDQCTRLLEGSGSD